MKNNKSSVGKDFYEKLYGNKEYIGGSGFKKSKIARLRYKKTFEVLKKYGFFRQGSQVLDIGCSTGEFLDRIPIVKGQKYGLDISEQAVTRANRNKDLKCSVCDVESQAFPYEDNKFDAIFITEVLEHLYSGKNVISEIKRTLKPNGKLFVTVPNDFLRFSVLIQMILKRKLLYEPIINDVYDVQHIRIFSKRLVNLLLLRNGFKIEYSGGFPLSYRGIRLPFGGFLANKFTNSFSRHFVVVCTLKR